MRRQPGEPLRHELHEREKRTQQAIWLARVDGSYYIGGGIGIASAALVPVATSYLVGPLHGWQLMLTLLVAAVIFVAWGYIVGKRGSRPRTNDRRRTEDIGKGLDAERSVGQAIDYAVAAPECAVAHNVTEIAKYGDIDHIVLTPARLWVIETKSGRVPNKEFRKARAQIAANVAAAREWAPDHGVQVPVQGCLVLPSGEVTARDERGYDDKASGEKILVEDRKSLVKKLRGESRGQQEADNEGVKNVWGLGKMEE